MAYVKFRAGLVMALALGLSASLASQAAAKEAALIVAVQGDVSPAPEAFSEAAEGASYALAPDAEMIVMHYAACVESHFKGGEITVGALGVKTTGELVGQTDVECPRKVAFAEDANAVAAVVLRGGEDRTLINAEPVFVLLKDGVESVEIRRAGVAVGRLDVAGRLARWPAGVAALPPGDDYEIALVMRGAERIAAAAVATDAGVTVVQP